MGINDCLSPTVILRIFSYLDHKYLSKCALVCKLWHNLAYCGINYKDLDFRKCVHVFDIFVERANKYLYSLNVSGTNIQDKQISLLTQNCPQIESIDLSNCRFLTDLSILSLANKCKYLKEVRLARMEIGDYGFTSLCLSCTQITLLDVSCCHRITNKGFEEIGRNLNILKTLIIIGSSSFADNSLISIGQSNPDLNTLILLNCKLISDMSILSIVHNCRGLQTLDVGRCHSLSPSTLNQIGFKCPELTNLSISDCPNITDDSIINLVKKCNHIRFLDLDNCYHAVTNRVLLEISANCSKLIYLCLSGCRQITDEGIVYLAASVCGKNSLRVLIIDNCTLLTPMSLLHLSLCVKLRRLVCFDNSEITSSAIRALKAVLPHLEVQYKMKKRVGNRRPHWFSRSSSRLVWFW